MTNEASVDPFPIGPSTIVGPPIAFRVLFCKSMSHLRHQIFRIFFSLVYRFKNFLAPVFSWLHPRNPQGILAMVGDNHFFFLLKRYTNVKVKAEMAYRRKFWRNMMRSALTYEEWAHATRMLDKETPKMNESDLYEEEVVRNKLQELHHRREEGSLRDIMFCMRADLVRISVICATLSFTWSAVTASCAFPGLFEAQELMAKDRSGEIVPYHSPFNLGLEEGSMPVRRWRDGSLEIDLPMMQLKELFNANHFIVSQANPHIAPLLRLKEFLAHLAEMEVKHRCNHILELGFPLGGIAKLFAQDWEGDVTVVMLATLAQYSKIIQNPTYIELQKAANQGRRCTWEKLSAIKANCGIELALDQCVVILNHMRRLKRSAERAAASSSHGLASSYKFSASRRISSWNCIAQENSSGSLEEDHIGDGGSSFHHGVGASASGVHSGKSFQTHRNMHDGRHSESESVDLNSWTRSGGPLMRTTSANKLIDFVQDLDVDSELNISVLTNPNSMTLQMGGNNHYHQSPSGTTPERRPESVKFDKREFGSVVSVNGSSIKVTEGELLQPERIHNGIVFNVVKKETLSSRCSHDLENYGSEVAECVQLDMDARSASEYDDAHISSTALTSETEPNCQSTDLPTEEERNHQSTVVA